jgi:hypothetical protein
MGTGLFAQIGYDSAQCRLGDWSQLNRIRFYLGRMRWKNLPKKMQTNVSKCAEVRRAGGLNPFI